MPCIVSLRDQVVAVDGRGDLLLDVVEDLPLPIAGIGPTPIPTELCSCSLAGFVSCDFAD